MLKKRNTEEFEQSHSSRDAAEFSDSQNSKNKSILRQSYHLMQTETADKNNTTPISAKELRALKRKEREMKELGLDINGNPLDQPPAPKIDVEKLEEEAKELVQVKTGIPVKTSEEEKKEDVEMVDENAKKSVQIKTSGQTAKLKRNKFEEGDEEKLANALVPVADYLTDDCVEIFKVKEKVITLGTAKQLMEFNRCLRNLFSILPSLGKLLIGKAQTLFNEEYWISTSPRHPKDCKGDEKPLVFDI